MSLDLIWKVAVAIFAAGGFVFAVRQQRKDLNGAMARVRRESEIANFRFLTQVIATLVYTEEPEKRKALGKMYLEAGHPEGRR